MSYFVCTYGNFPGQNELVERSFREKVYLLHQYARYPSAIDEVHADDVLLLNVRGKGIVAYAYAAENVKHIEATDKWNHVLNTRNGWQKGKSRGCWLPYGIAWATLQGGQFSLVKKVESTWADGIFDEMGWERPAQQPSSSADVRFRDGTPSSIAKELMNGSLEIPPIQRGVVWNATRLEVLWDSIMRGIPIGTFSIQASKNNEGHWELLDGQQRATAIMSAYRPFPPEPTPVESLDGPDAQKNAMLAPVVWIDLMPKEMYGRKFIFRVTTGSQPWGYYLTDDETGNKAITEEAKRDMCMKYEWHNKNTANLLASALKPYPCELVPNEAGCPIPFSIILKCCEEQKAYNTRNPSLDEFIQFCNKEMERAQSRSVEGLHPWNWFKHGLCDKVCSSRDEVEQAWDNLVKRVYGLDEYLILQVNARSIDDVGTYFRRIGRGGVTPSQEEMNYSMLKARLPSLKRGMEQVATKGWASPSRMAMLALRTWQAHTFKDGGNSSVEKLVNDICANSDLAKSFEAYTSIVDGVVPSFLKDLNELDEMLGVNKEGGLLPWHRMILCTRSNGEICRYLLRLIAKNRDESDKVNFAGLAAFLLYCSDVPERVISHHLNKKSSIHEGIASAYRDSYWGRALLRRLAFPDEIDLLLRKVDCEDWIGAWERIQSDPAWQPVVQTITMGYRSQAAYSVLLFGCRRFVNDVFLGYNSLLPIWSEENCPWDYDHIFPKDMVDVMKDMAPGCENVLHSIGNLAPLPFSLNRAKHDTLPTEAYPLANDSEIDEGQQMQLVKYKKGLMLLKTDEEVYDYSKFSQGDCVNAREVFIQTIRRFSFLYRDWFENLNLQTVVPQSTGRRILFDELNEALAGGGFSVWILAANGYERKMEESPIFSKVDWIVSSWMSFGKCTNGFLIAYGDDGWGTFATGICKLPNQDKTLTNVTIPEIDGFDRLDKDDYWYCRKKYPARPEVEMIKADIKRLEEQVMSLSPANVS